MADRKALLLKEVQEKRIRAQQLREQRATTSTAAAAAGSGAVTPRASPPPPASMDALLASIPSLLGTKQPSTTTTSSSSSSSSAPLPSTTPAMIPPSQSPVLPSQQTPATSTRRATMELSIVTCLASVDIVPKELIQHSRGTQTQDDLAVTVAPPTTTTTEQLMQSTITDNNNHEPQQPTTITSTTNDTTTMTMMGDEDKAAIMNATDFRQWVSRASRVMERAVCLNERFPNVLTDYLGTSTATDDDGGDTLVADLTAGSSSSGAAVGQSLCCVGSLTPPAGRGCGGTVTSLAWSLLQPDLILTSHYTSDSSNNTNNNTSSCVNIWSVPSVTKEPEITLFASSPITSAIFSPTQPFVVIGGTKTGNLLLWDTRCSGGNNGPVFNRAPSRLTHTYPLYSLMVLSSGGGEQKTLGTVSSDGLLCIWSLNSSSQNIFGCKPLDTIDLLNSSKASDITAITTGAKTGERNSFIIGREDGTVATYEQHVKMMGSFDVAEQKHNGPVMALDVQPSSSPSTGGGGMVVSCSVDWTVKLWDSGSTKSKQLRVVREFEDLGDYVFDVKWCPAAAVKHSSSSSSLFATADGLGYVSVFDVNSSINSASVKAHTATKSPLTCLKWSTTGSMIVSGDALGSLNLFSFKN